MDLGNDADGMSRHLHAAQVDVIQDFETATLKCKQLLDDSATKYEQLLEKYTALKDMIDAQHGQAPMSEERDSSRDYVLVLVDGHSHKFDDKFPRGGAVNGRTAVQAIRDEVSAHLTRKLPKQESHRLIIKVIGSLNTMAAKYRKNKEGTVEATRNLECLAEEFSSLQTWSDFILLREPQEVENKIIGLLEWHVRDPRCQYIILGVHGSGKYLKTLYAVSKHHEKITLVQGSYIDLALGHLGLPFVNLSTFVSPASNNNALTNITSRGDDPEDLSKLLKNPSKESEDNTREARSGAGANGYFENNRYIQYTQPNDDQKQTPSTSILDTKPHSSSINLPKKERPGLIPINSKGHRLDLYLCYPSGAQWQAFYARVRVHKLCSHFHLRSSCPNIGCEYDHSSISDDERVCLKFLAADRACDEKGACRRLDCYHGHICQKTGCRRRKSSKCKYRKEAHNVDWKVADWVQPGNFVVPKGEKNVQNWDVKNTTGSMENWPTMVGDLIDI